MMGKKAVKAKFLTFQNKTINRSLTVLDKDLNKIAVQLHRNLLGYMGDKQMAYPATLAHNVILKGNEMPELVDEIYAQIIKQVSDNPADASEKAGWQLMCMCTGVFPPSRDFEYFLLHFIHKTSQLPGYRGEYATYALRRLEGILLRANDVRAERRGNRGLQAAPADACHDLLRRRLDRDGQPPRRRTSTSRRSSSCAPTFWRSRT